tara:strand:+ start:101 stop:3241 length:3141 start_codon:yes stop_codon:yes gene_type:complete
MAEVKNAFIKSKMNKDLDARLIPNGEYRDARNIQVSRSQGDDVGALENILGNAVTVNGDFAADASAPNIECIGYVVDESTSFVYLFFTDYTDPYAGDVSTYSITAKNFIYAYNTLSNQRVKLLEGAFLNFSTNRPIIGVNLLENLLFWTDNRNQPRKINVDLAVSNGVTYYDTEDKISVAKYNPYQSPELIREISSGVYETTMYDVSNQFLPAIGTAAVNGAVTSSVNITVDAKTGSIVNGSNVTGTNVTAGTTVVSFNASNGLLVVSSAQTLADNTELFFQESNPYYNADFPGDPQYLEDKFVRFSYRFKFIDGEYSIIAPFTQEAFIPKQDGYFMIGDEEQTTLSTVVDFMENKVNKIDVQIPLPNGTTSDNLLSDYLITEIDIIYKESDSNVVQVVETIPVSSITGNVSTYVYSYVSQKPYKTLPSDETTRVYDKVPVKALGQEVASNRVIYSNFQDKHTPPNFIDYQVGANEKLLVNAASSSKTTVEYPNHNLKQNRNYQVGIVLADKFGRQSTVILSNNTDNVDSSGLGADTVYLPYNSANDSIGFLGKSIKTRFNTVLSGVGIDKDEKTGTPGLYNDTATSLDYNPLGWYSYKIVVKQTEQEYYNVYIGGAIKGQPYWTNGSNPPVATAVNPLDQNATFVTLLNDNINKVPRDLTEVGAQDKQFRSSVRLFGRVENTAQSFSNVGNRQYIPGRKSFTVNQIEDLFDAFDVMQFKGGGTDVIPVTSTNSPYYAFFRSESNPFIAEFVTSTKAEDQFGIVNNGYANQNTSFNRFENLNILETKPTISRLDIYWETSTSGLISELNQAINAGDQQASKVSNWTYNHSEASSPLDVIVNDFVFQDILGATLTVTGVPTMTVTDNSGADRTSEFEIIAGGSANTFRIRIASGKYFYYEQTQALNIFNFVFDVVISGSTNTVSKLNQPLTNIAPTITNTATDTILLFEGVRDIPLANGTPSGKATGVNGSNASGGKSTDGLIFSIISQSGVGNFEIDTTDGVSVINTDGTAVGNATFKLKLEDGGSPSNLSTTKIFSVNFSASNPI